MLFTQMLVSTSYRKKTQVTSSTNRKKIKPFFHEIRETMGHRIFIKCTLDCYLYVVDKRWFCVYTAPGFCGEHNAQKIEKYWKNKSVFIEH